MASQIPTANSAGLLVLLTQTQNIRYTIANNMAELVKDFNLQGNSPFTASRLKTYFYIDKTIARINIVLSDGPYTSEAVDTIDHLREATH